MTEQILTPSLTAELTARFHALNAQTNETLKDQSFSCLLLGRPGVGKTHMLTTLPAPIYIYSFDPKGWQLAPIKQGMAEGRIIVDNRYEKGDAASFDLWQDTFIQDRRAGVFDAIGSVVIDSGTLWGDAMMQRIFLDRKNDEVAKMKGGAITWRQDVSQIQDYGAFKNRLIRMIRAMSALPCNFILTGHIEIATDPVTGGHLISICTEGEKVKDKIPNIFSEIWLLEANSTQEGYERYVLTYPATGKVLKSRIALEAGFERKEKPDFKYLLKKAGLPYEDKPLIKMEN